MHRPIQHPNRQPPPILSPIHTFNHRRRPPTTQIIQVPHRTHSAYKVASPLLPKKKRQESGVSKHGDQMPVPRNNSQRAPILREPQVRVRLTSRSLKVNHPRIPHPPSLQAKPDQPLEHDILLLLKDLVRRSSRGLSTEYLLLFFSSSSSPCPFVGALLEIRLLITIVGGGGPPVPVPPLRFAAAS